MPPVPTMPPPPGIGGANCFSAVRRPDEPSAPASLLQVAGTGRIVREKSLELWERLWEPKIATLVNVHEHGRTLPLVAVGDNRIGKAYSKRLLRLPAPASVNSAARRGSSSLKV